MKSVFLLIILAVSLGLGQIPIPCKTPPQWKSKFYLIDYDFKVIVNSDFIYDSINKRKRTIQEIHSMTDPNETSKYDVVDLFNDDLQYVYDFKTGKCLKVKIVRPWLTLDVPDNSTFVEEAYIGSSGVPGASLLVTRWVYDFFDAQGNPAHYSGIWTYEGCLPVHNVYQSKAQFLDQHTSFYNITIGIDPDSFKLRPECNQTEDKHDESEKK